MGTISVCTGFISWWHSPCLKVPAAWEITLQVVSLVCLFMRAFHFDFESSERSCWHFEEDMALGVSSNNNNEYLECLPAQALSAYTFFKCTCFEFWQYYCQNSTHTTHTHARTDAHTHAHTHTRMHTLTCTHKHTHAHAHTLTHTHSHISGQWDWRKGFYKETDVCCRYGPSCSHPCRALCCRRTGQEMPPVIALTSLIFSTRPTSGGCWLSTSVSVAVATSTRPTPQARWESGSPKHWEMMNRCRPTHGAGVSTFAGTWCTIICQMCPLLFRGLKMWSKQSDMSRLCVSLGIVWYCVSLGIVWYCVSLGIVWYCVSLGIVWYCVSLWIV